ncbi:MAG: helix-turn-helix domain-containing protein [Planctomycetota bacterium]|nr:MAG: helix-turn-helix domain-containing protein [Planctomycetota bacterium]
MAENDFGVAELAAYLHLDAAQVLRLAERQQIPARKVGGQWRFSRAEVHHWLEERIGLSTDEELVQMEGVLQRAAGGGETDISIIELLPLEAIAVPLAARTRGSVISKMVDTAAQTGWLWDTAKMAEAVRAREDMLPTAIETGVALLHPRRPLPNLLGQAFVALGRTETGIPFGAARGGLTDIFFLILSDSDASHLRVLARLSRLIGDPGLLEALRSAPDARAARQAIDDQEQQLSP